MKMLVPHRGRLFAAFGLVLAFALADAVVSYRMTLRLIENERWVTHTHEVLNELEGTLSALKDAETGERGYIITGDESYLAPYKTGIVEVQEHLGSLRSLTADNARQQRRIAELAPLIARRLEQLQRGLESFRTAGPEAARATVLMGTGQQTMDAVRWIAAQMTASETALLRRRSEISRESGRTVLWTLSIANLLLVGLILLTAYLTQRDLQRRRQAETALLAARDELEVRVRERTAELATANEHLRQSALELERSNRELQDFAFVASHDLQEPLRKIQAFGDRLRGKHGEALGPEGIDYLERMQRAAHRMHVLINDLLTFSRVTSRGQPFVPTDLGQIAREVLSDLEVRVEQTGGRVEIGGLPTLDADPLQMRQLLQNLLGNGLKFHRDGEPPVVRISGSVLADGGPPRARIVVADNGIGFDMKYLDRIFTPFQRLHGRTEYEGTGIGLAVCRRIVERHGGTLTAESAPGQGARFLVTLPVQQTQGESAA
ncbi:MAG TPA: CHASE3 domain-containing protein [Thermoanaerobaculia bacterium]|jgi:signal transduction histidine kinase